LTLWGSFGGFRSLFKMWVEKKKVCCGLVDAQEKKVCLGASAAPGTRGAHPHMRVPQSLMSFSSLSLLSHPLASGRRDNYGQARTEGSSVRYGAKAQTVYPTKKKKLTIHALLEKKSNRKRLEEKGSRRRRLRLTTVYEVLSAQRLEKQSRSENLLRAC